MAKLLVVDRYVHRAPFNLEAMGLMMPTLQDIHPNRLAFTGVVTRVDEPSTRPPNGSRGHRVLIPSYAAEQALPTLIGMGVDVASSMKDHDKRQKIGVITEADIVGKDLVISGHLFAKDFAAEVTDIQRNKAALGFSYEISDVHVEDEQADIWTLTHFIFTGAAILEKRSAAYVKTSIAAHAEEDSMAGVADEVLTKLTKIDSTLRSIQAAQQDEDDAAAAKDETSAQEQDATAARYAASALQAREDKDEEDAARQDAEAAKARDAASAFRLVAAKRHEDAAARLRAGTDTEDAAAKETAEAEAKRHEEEAKRLKDMDDKCKADAAAEKADADAAKAQEESASAGDVQAKAMAQVLMAMMGKEMPQDAAAKPKKDEKDDPNVHMLGMLLRAMTYMPGMMAEAAAKKPHDDEEDDKELIRQMLRKGKQSAGVEASRGVVNLEDRRRMRQMEAAMALLTDQVSKLTGLMTDMVHSGRGLATDTNRGANGGPAERRSMHATTEQWVSKGDGTTDPPQRRSDGKMTLKEIHAALDAEGISDPAERIARQANLQFQGKIAY